ncbi:LysR family transcriptional regulator [soil metagenome]
MPTPDGALPAAATWGRLNTFLAVYDARSVGAAATNLHVTPPAVSAAVTALERGLGVPLFTKAGRGITPTDAGHTFAGYVRTMIGLLSEAAAAVCDAETGRLRLGAVATAGEYVLPGLTASFLTAHPRIELSLEVLPRDDLFARAQHHELDVVIAGRPPAGSGLLTRARRPNRLLAVRAPDTPSDPRAARWLLRGHGSGTRETALGLLQALDARPATLTLGTSGAVVAAARHGLGTTLVHEDAVRDDLTRGLLVPTPVPGTPLDRPWHLCTPPDPTPAALLFLTHVTDRVTAGSASFTA